MYKAISINLDAEVFTMTEATITIAERNNPIKVRVSATFDNFKELSGTGLTFTQMGDGTYEFILADYKTIIRLW